MVWRNLEPELCGLPLFCIHISLLLWWVISVLINDLLYFLSPHRDYKIISCSKIASYFLLNEIRISSNLHTLAPVCFPNLFSHFYLFNPESCNKHFPLTYTCTSSMPLLSPLPGMSFLNPTFSLKISSISIMRSNPVLSVWKLYFIFLGLLDQPCNNTVVARYLWILLTAGSEITLSEVNTLIYW